MFVANLIKTLLPNIYAFKDQSKRCQQRHRQKFMLYFNTEAAILSFEDFMRVGKI